MNSLNKGTSSHSHKIVLRIPANPKWADLAAPYKSSRWLGCWQSFIWKLAVTGLRVSVSLRHEPLQLCIFWGMLLIRQNNPSNTIKVELECSTDVPLRCANDTLRSKCPKWTWPITKRAAFLSMTSHSKPPHNWPCWWNNFLSMQQTHHHYLNRRDWLLGDSGNLLSKSNLYHVFKVALLAWWDSNRLFASLSETALWVLADGTICGLIERGIIAYFLASSEIRGGLTVKQFRRQTGSLT